MHSITLWKRAQDPNYSTNVDRTYPYSEVPYVGKCKLVKIPISLKDLIDHVDYWGEGRVTTPQGTSGFSNCYNINHAYHLVSYGSDRDRKIPNRIPVISETESNTRAYVEENSVLTVTVMGAPIKSSCAADIARIINNDMGIVVAYGYEPDSEDIANLTEQLKNKYIYHSPSYELPEGLQKVTRYDTHRIFVNIGEIKTELTRLVIKEDYESAVYVTKSLSDEVSRNVIDDLFKNILNGDSVNYNKLMSYAYQLSINGGENIVLNYFPTPIRFIFGKEEVEIINEGYNQPLKLGEYIDKDGDRFVWGAGNLKSRLCWQFKPMYVNKRVIFTIYNVDSDMYLKSAVAKDNDGDRETYASKDCNTDRHKYIVEPCIQRRKFCFHLINYEYRQGLKLAMSTDSYGDRRVFGHNGDIYKVEDRFTWTVVN